MKLSKKEVIRLVRKVSGMPSEVIFPITSRWGTLKVIVLESLRLRTIIQNEVFQMPLEISSITTLP